MPLSDLIEFVEALNYQRGKKLLPTPLTSAELRDVFAWEKRQSVFSAQMDLLEQLQEIKDVTEAVINPRTETRADGSQFTSGMDQATARLKLKESLARLGYQPDDDERGTIQDQSSFERRSLVVRTNVELAQGVGHFQQSNQADVVDAFPCWELVRFEQRKEPRDWQQRWTIAAQTVGDSSAMAAMPRMIARKDSPIWQELGDAEDGLGNPYPPFAFNSGMWVQDVPRQECVELGVIDAAEEVAPQELELPELPLTNRLKLFGLMNREDEGGVWRTINGTPVFIKDGQSVGEAVKEKFGGKFGGEKKTAETKSEGKKLQRVKDRAWRGKSVTTKTKLSKLETGEIGERVTIQYLKDQGFKDARTLNVDRNNFPLDLVQNHEAIEVKTGLVSNGDTAQHWRATIGQPGPEERKWLKTASKEAKAKWNAKKAQAILDRKAKAVKEVSKKLGRKVHGKTVTLILNPDKKTADIFEFEGFHSRIPWNSPHAKGAYKGTFKYA